jgi:hypothetical protein
MPSRAQLICALTKMTTRLFRLLGVAFVLAALAHPLGAMTQRDRSSYLDWMLKSLPSAPQFAQWQQRTGLNITPLMAAAGIAWAEPRARSSRMPSSRGPRPPRCSKS